MKITCFLACFILLTAAVSGQNKKDRPPSYLDDIGLKWEQSSDSTNLLLFSKSYAPIEFVFSEKATEKEFSSFLLEPFDSMVVLTLPGTDLDALRQMVSEQYKMSYFLGHPALMSPDTNFSYRLPFEKGKK